MNRSIAIFTAKATLGAALALGFLAAHGTAHAAAAGVDAYAYEGDDNGDGIVTEDESGWSCVDDGNKVCGPGNANGQPAGRYAGGVLVDPWPVDS